jgi:hypothetical protein
VTRAAIIVAIRPLRDAPLVRAAGRRNGEDISMKAMVSRCVIIPIEVEPLRIPSNRFKVRRATGTAIPYAELHLIGARENARLRSLEDNLNPLWREEPAP